MEECRMAVITVRDALRQAMDEELARDDAVILMGEEVGEYDGAYKVSQGLLDKYGPERIIDTPITEEGFAGIGIGAAMAGLRPIVEFMTWNFAFMAFDQLISNAAKMRHMSGGQITIPVVFRGPNGPAEYLSSQHSQACQTFFVHCPGLLVVAPSTAYDAKGLLKSAIRNDNPVVFLEAEMMYNWKGEVPDAEYLVPLGEAVVRRAGADVTLLGYGKPMRLVEAAAEQLADAGVEAEVIDLRSLRPLDTQAVVRSVAKTNRCVIVDESWPVCSFASYLAALVGRECFDLLDAPVETITGEDVPMPYNHTLELAAQPSVEKIVAAARRTLYL
jgi:pyruvate dehydrogenase E1 component beta subunit